MRKLHLVGFTADREGLILSDNPDDPASEPFVVVLDDDLRAAVRSQRARSAALPTSVNQAAGDTGTSSTLTVREMQARLRRGYSIKQVASEAKVRPQWVERFATPVIAEQAKVVADLKAATFETPRKGRSSAPIGEAVAHNLAVKGVAVDDELATDNGPGWRAHQLHEEVWSVRFTYESRNRRFEAEWVYDLGEGEVSAANPLAGQLAFREATGGSIRNRSGESVEEPPAPAAPARAVGSGRRTEGGRTQSRGAQTRRGTTERVEAARRAAATRKAAEAKQAAARRAADKEAARQAEAERRAEEERLAAEARRVAEAEQAAAARAAEEERIRREAEERLREVAEEAQRQEAAKRAVAEEAQRQEAARRAVAEERRRRAEAKKARAAAEEKQRQEEAAKAAADAAGAWAAAVAAQRQEGARRAAAEERRRRAEAKKAAAEEKEREEAAAEEKQRQEEAAKRTAAEERRRRAEARKAVAAARREAVARVAAEEKERQEAAKRAAAEEKRRQEEAAKAAEMAAAALAAEEQERQEAAAEEERQRHVSEARVNRRPGGGKRAQPSAATKADGDQGRGPAKKRAAPAERQRKAGAKTSSPPPAKATKAPARTGRSGGSRSVRRRPSTTGGSDEPPADPAIPTSNGAAPQEAPVERPAPGSRRLARGGRPVRVRRAPELDVNGRGERRGSHSMGAGRAQPSDGPEGNGDAGNPRPRRVRLRAGSRPPRDD